MINDKDLAMITGLLGGFYFSNSNPAYDVMTALRGPDQLTAMIRKDVWNAINFKEAITGVIRWRVGMKPRHGVLVAVGDSEELCQVRRDVVNEDYAGFVINDGYLEFCHYLNHAHYAFEALGLKWCEVNQIPLVGKGAV